MILSVPPLDSVQNPRIPIRKCAVAVYCTKMCSAQPLYSHCTEIPGFCVHLRNLCTLEEFVYTSEEFVYT